MRVVLIFMAVGMIVTARPPWDSAGAIPTDTIYVVVVADFVPAAVIELDPLAVDAQELGAIIDIKTDCRWVLIGALRECFNALYVVLDEPMAELRFVFPQTVSA